MRQLGIIIFILALACLWSCSPTKHVPQGQYLLDRVNIRVENDDSIEVAELYNFLRQTPNHKVLGFAKLQLATYSLSGADSSKWYNKWLRNLGQPPVIYDQQLTDVSRKQLRQALINRGYMDVDVKVDTTMRPDKKKIDVTYSITPGSPHRIASIGYEIADLTIDSILRENPDVLSIKSGDLFDRNMLDNTRAAIAAILRNNGYYTFSKENITFVADTVKGSKDISLTMHLKSSARPGPVTPEDEHLPVYTIRKVYVITDFDPADDYSAMQRQDTVSYRGLDILYGADHYLAPSIIEEKCYLAPGQIYNSKNVELTYEGLTQLGILRYVNIELKDAAPNSQMLDAYILLSRGRKQSVSLEVEGTNSEGDLGFGIGATYKHHNLAKKSEELTVKLRTAYESLSGNAEGFINNRYSEYAGEVGITFPKFEFPFLSNAYKKKWRASTEFALSGNYQERPEYTRVIAGAAWKYKWHRQRNRHLFRYTFDLIDINYVRLPKSTINFLDSIAPSNPLLRYSYEDHFIMRMGFSFYRTNRRAPSAGTALTLQPTISTVRGSAEMAGNLLYAISSLSNQKKNDGAYKIFGIQYAQYVKFDLDYSYTINFNSRNSVALHAYGGIAVPYLNSQMVPFEKRFYAGGANNVRGWGVRSLGPGSYDSRNSVTDFINQCGDISLLFNAEYRAKLFWVFEGALFIDAGNIWTIRDYENQPGGVFKFNKFYRQIAAAYGIGLRMDFTYFLLRFDLGIKAHNPANNQEHWPLLHPRWKRDTNFHFTVGYPF